jgi:antitoxin component of MazEF toxin-antitoxin module
MGLKRKIIMVGGDSVGVILPVSFLKASKISDGDEITFKKYEFNSKNKKIKSETPFSRNIIKIANSMGFTIPVNILEADDIKKGDYFIIRDFETKKVEA